MSKTENCPSPIVLAILDGWGLSSPNKGNAVTLAKTPVIDALTKDYPFTTLQSYGTSVGLPGKQDGNSEAGHMNLGAGRIVEQDSVEIGQTITTSIFFKNPALLGAISHVKEHGSDLHLMGLLSEQQSAHMDPDHLLALITLLRVMKVKRVYWHFFTDGRDSPKFIAAKLLKRWEATLEPNEQIASIMGRYYAMDRGKNWQRTEKAYNALVLGEGYSFSNAHEAVIRAYNREENDEFISPSLIIQNDAKSNSAKGRNKPRVLIKDDDAIIFFNLRSDRARQISKCFVQSDFNKKNPKAFRRKKILKNLFFVAMTDFGPDLGNLLTAFPARDLLGTLPMAMNGYRQLYIAESEKYAHVTYFFNGGYPDPVNKEDRIIIQSPSVRSYDERPEMSASKLTGAVIDNLKNKVYNFITLNYANPDMIGHTGNLRAGVKACEVVDKCVGILYQEIKRQNGILIVTADHGNVEEMINLKTGEIDTKHSTNPVPFILVGDKLKNKKLASSGVLADVAPTILKLAGLEKPKEMTRSGLL
ncbi:2,3-bisphosphoglycerate-independent phosphoglycerate mutase [Patescibacteria group bacterium]|nr:2,3-bisphosphoglycerate-independent phosphoglycerate mutase [Patescibacteria group bacterium]MBU4511936.1 2,3-bisphosphoglycerate-independent phosphoglycerate mutase [Patescibacteria group bacterium]MCG2692904.1 2,3-bisphosphoglycerate-independent phosphoglycerate mutase [Candidatus Parcubacteria bacterium]